LALSLGARAEPARVPGADPSHPDLGVWNASTESVGRGQFVGVDLKRTGLNVDGGELPFVPCFQALADGTLVNFISALGEFFLTVARFRSVHFDSASEK
jgi:hypothetical protein